MPAFPGGDLQINEPARPPQARATLILAHGAGAGMDSHPLKFFAEALAAQNIRVVRFEFPYMRRRSTEGRRGAPDRPQVLLETWRDVIREVRAAAPGAPDKAAQGAERSLFIGGKSMGGRIASMVADEAAVTGLICLGYPFHPPGKPQQLRVAHLKNLKTPALILQGERDPFGSPADVAAYPLSPAIRVVWIPDGDHSFKPRKQSGHTERQNLDLALAEILAFVSGLVSA